MILLFRVLCEGPLSPIFGNPHLEAEGLELMCGAVDGPASTKAHAALLI